MNRTDIGIGAIVLILTFLLGFACGMKYEKPVSVHETPLPAIQQKDGSVVVQRAPESVASPSIVPHGTVVQRVDRIVVQTKLVPIAAVTNNATVTFTAQDTPQVEHTYTLPSQALIQECRQIMTCPSTTVTLTTVKQEDGTQRVVAMAQDGSIVSAMDSPWVNDKVEKDHDNGIGFAVPMDIPGSSSIGIAYSHDFHAIPVTAGLDGWTINGRAALLGTVEWRF